MCAILHFCQTPIKVGLPMHGQFYPHFGGGVHKQPTVNLDSNLVGTIFAFYHWSWHCSCRLHICFEKSNAPCMTSGDFLTAINLKFPSIAFSAQAYNWFPLIAGAAASEKCIKLAWHTHCPHQEVYLCMIDSEGWISILRKWRALCKTH